MHNLKTVSTNIKIKIMYSKRQGAGYNSKSWRKRMHWMDIIRSEEYGHYMERSQRTVDSQSRMASRWGPMHPPGCVL